MPQGAIDVDLGRANALQKRPAVSRQDDVGKERLPTLADPTPFRYRSWINHGGDLEPQAGQLLRHTGAFVVIGQDNRSFARHHAIESSQTLHAASQENTG